MYLAPHMEELFTLIRRRAIIQYCAPYVSTDIRIMAEVFRTSTNDVCCLSIKILFPILVRGRTCKVD